MGDLYKESFSSTLFSIIIPTMQKNLDVLNMLVDELVENETVGEVIIIDNSLKGFDYDSEKVRVIVPKKNLYVNPSWNLGVKEAKYDYVGILNDDILIPKNLCEQILDILQNKPNIGLIGLDSDIIHGTDEEDMDEYPIDSEIQLNKIESSYMTKYWGSAIWGNKKNYYFIPEDIKIWCGDNFLLFNNLKNNKECYQIINCEIKHLGSLSVKTLSKIEKILKSDVYKYAKIDKQFKQFGWYVSKRKEVLSNLLSLKNSKDKRHKILRVLGLKIKFKNPKYEAFRNKKLIDDLKNFKYEYEKYINLINIPVKENSVLLFEPNADCHSEVVPGFAKYFLDLGYNVDVLIASEIERDKAMCRLKHKHLRIFSLDSKYFYPLFLTGKLMLYKFIFSSSDITYNCIPAGKRWINLFDRFPLLKNYKDNLFVVEHHLDLINCEELSESHYITLKKFPDKKFTSINPNYFGKVKITNKSEKLTNFIVVGVIDEKRRKNCDLLIDVANTLITEGIKDFCITIIGCRYLNLNNIPKNLRKYFNIMSKTSYDIIYNEMEKADFFLPLLDPTNKAQERYLTCGVTGSYQLIQGFLKPCIIAEKFAQFYKFDNKNAILYETNNDLAKAMLSAINMNSSDYSVMQNSLKELATENYEESINNLQNLLEIESDNAANKIHI